MTAYESIASDVYGAAKASMTVTKPTGTVEGDRLTAVVFVLSNVTPDTMTPPSGFAEAPGTWPLHAAGGGEHAHVWIYDKLAGASEPASYVFTPSEARPCQATMIRSSSVDASTPFDVIPSQNTGTGATCTWTGITPVTNGALIYAVECDFADNATDTIAPTGTTPTFTERQDNTLTYVASGVLATAAATGNKTHTCNNTAGSPFLAVLIALRPASGPVGTTYTRTGTAIVGP